MSVGPSPTLEQARSRLRELGYLEGRVERFLFRRAFEGRGGLLLPAVLAGALAAATAGAAATASGEAGLGESPETLAVLLLHLFVATVLPAAVGSLLLRALADRSRSPAATATALGLAAAVFTFGLWVGGTYLLAREIPAESLLWGFPVAAAALLFARSVRSGFLARAYAHSRILPASRHRRVFFGAAVLGMIAAAAVFASRRSPLPVAPPRPAVRSGSVVVVAVDGLDLDAPGSEGSAAALLAGSGSVGWWPAESGSPPEIWTRLSTGVPAGRHGVRALERVRPLGSPRAFRPPLGSAWYFRGVGPLLATVSSAPVSAADRRSLTFWEVAASAGLPARAVGWWASGPWPGATVFGNERILEGASTGLDVDRRARALLRESARDGARIRTVYLPGADILRRDSVRRAVAVAETGRFLEEEVSRARREGDVLILLAADSHPPAGGRGRMVVFEPGGTARLSVRIRPEDVAPSILARAGIPVARDLPGRSAIALFAPGTLDASTVETYGPRLAAGQAPARHGDREYLQRLKSLGYLN